LDAVGQILRRDGYETLSIDEAREALTILAENDIDLVILDYNMPDMDGLHVLREIKKTRPHLPVIMMTAEPSKELRFASLEGGAYSFISKPINIPSLRQIILKALRSPKMRNMEVRRQLVFTRWIRWIINK
jgi:DNA-binding NtrC family response regulator